MHPNLVTLNTVVELIAGHDPGADVDPEWTGTVQEFYLANPDVVEARHLMLNLQDGYAYRFGGGAEQAFTIRLPRRL